MRLFAAVRPPVDVLEHLRRALVTVAQGSPEVRWTAEENWHLTLAFYGTVPDGVVPELGSALADAATTVDPMELRLRGAGQFAHRTLWVGASGEVTQLTVLSAAAGDVGEDLLGRRDERPRTRPHLTVGRVPAAVRHRRTGDRRRAGGSAAPVHGEAGDLAGLVSALALYEGPSWTVAELLLVESRPGQGRGGGPLYTDVDRYPLGRAAGTRER